MFSSFNPVIVESAVAVPNSDANNIEKPNNDQRKGAERFFRFYDGLVSFTKVWGILTAIGEYVFLLFVVSWQISFTRLSRITSAYWDIRK